MLKYVLIILYFIKYYMMHTKGVQLLLSRIELDLPRSKGGYHTGRPKEHTRVLPLVSVNKHRIPS